MRKSRRYWTPYRCFKEASKYQTKKEWRLNNESSYKAALEQNIIQICSAHMKPLPKGLPRRFTLEECKKIASQFKTRQEWRKKHPKSYKCAAQAGWYEECVKSIPKTRGLWNTIEKCKNESIKYKSRGEWRRKSPSSYTYASRKGWLNLCCEHMVSSNREDSIEFEIKKIVKEKYFSANSKRFAVKDNKFYAKYFEIDIFIPELNKGIEFDGKYWHSFKSLKKRFPKWPENAIKNYHQIKDEFFKTLNIEILHIKEEDWLLNKEKEIQKIMSFIGDLNA
jgi:hypothetical protein